MLKAVKCAGLPLSMGMLRSSNGKSGSEQTRDREMFSPLTSHHRGTTAAGTLEREDLVHYRVTIILQRESLIKPTDRITASAIFTTAAIIKYLLNNKR